MQAYIEQLLQSPSPVEWLRFTWILLGISATVAIGEGIRYLLHWSPEFTRKLVHISVAILIFFAPNLFKSAIPPLLLAISFTSLTFIAIKFGLLKSLHAVSRGAYGTVYYPLAFLTLILLFWNSHPEIVSLSMLVLGIGDASAAIVGESIKNPTVYRLTSDKKSIQGSTAMFVTSVLALIVGCRYFEGTTYSYLTLSIAVLSASLIATACEALSSRALDNLTIPLSVGFVLYYVLVPSSLQNDVQFALGVGLGVAIALIAYHLRFLKASGAVATFLLASLLFGVGGWKWTVPMLTFFILSSVLSKIGRTRKRETESVFEKSGTRDAGQVASNGGVAGILAILQYLFQDVNFYPFYLGTVAAVTADTWGTEIGTYFRGTTVSVVTLRKVSPGVSGGISVAGVLGAVVGSVVVVLSGAIWVGTISILFAATVAGIIGSVIDSVAGATVQARYRCNVCGKTTERIDHCGSSTDLVGGFGWINNDMVNWICAIAGAAVVLLLV